MRRCLTFSFVIFCFNFLHAQKESNIWYFGNKAGLDFNVNPPVALTNGAMSTNEGCASISDKNGQILFYTDGITVYTKTHQVMVNGNGLLGHSSSTQSASIVPWPGRDSLYYIITVDAYDNKGLNGYNYSVVNMNKNGGQGEVVVKNQLLYSPSTEKLTIAKHNNDVDWWVITRQLGNNQFKIYLIDKDGINTTPVTSTIGAIIPVTTQAYGCMSVSPDNKKLAVAYTFASYFEIYDFDNDKGTLSNPIGINNQLPYGLAFSPDAKMLYVSSTMANNGKISQYDISTAKDPVSIEATRTVITPVTSTLNTYGLQLGPDNKIYLNCTNAIAVIHEPNNKGIACRLEENAINLKGRKPGIMFPAIIPHKQILPVNFTIDANVTITDTCKREVQLQAISNQLTNVTYKWNFGNGSSSTIHNPEKVFPYSTNVYSIELEIAADVLTASGQQRQARTITKHVQFEPLPQANAGDDLVALAGVPLHLNGSGGVRYEWEPALYLNDPFIANPVATLQKDQAFILKASNADGCTDTDTVAVKVYKESMIYVPTGFTPNGDGINDVLKVFPAAAKLETFSVVNRWGTTLFTTNDSSKGWNGQYRGKLQPAGTYIWIVKGTGLNGQPIFKKGTVTLVR